MKFAKLMMAAAITAGTLFVIIGCGESQSGKPQSGKSQRQLQQESLANLKQIGTACKMYSADCCESFPVNLSGLVTQSYLTDPKVFVSPLDKKRTPADFSKFPNYRTHRPQDVYSFSFPEANLSYVYLGAGLKETTKPEFPIAFEKPDLVIDGLSINVLFADGSVRNYCFSKKDFPRTCFEVVKHFVAPLSNDKDYSILLKNAEAFDMAN